MNGMIVSLGCVLWVWALVTVVLVALVIYGNTLAIREDDQLYLSKAQEIMMAAEQRILIGKMDDLARTVMCLAALSAILLLVGATMWIAAEFYGF